MALLLDESRKNLQLRRPGTGAYDGPSRREDYVNTSKHSALPAPLQSARNEERISFHRRPREHPKLIKKEGLNLRSIVLGARFCASFAPT